MNADKLSKCIKLNHSIHALERASDYFAQARKDPEMVASLDGGFYGWELSESARAQILRIAQSDIDEQLCAAKAAFEVL